MSFTLGALFYSSCITLNISAEVDLASSLMLLLLLLLVLAADTHAQVVLILPTACRPPTTPCA